MSDESKFSRAVSLRLPEEMHRKLRWVAFNEDKSLSQVLVDITTAALADVEPVAEDTE